MKVFSIIYNSTFRAKIIDIQANCCSVFYLDYGDTEVVELSKLFELSDDLKQKVSNNFI